MAQPEAEDQISNAALVERWETYAERLTREGKESTNEYAEVMRQLCQARLALAGEQRYLRERTAEGEKEWARLLAMVEGGKHPSEIELADALFQYGIVPVSDAAQYVARRLVGDVKAPKKKGRKSKPRPDDFSLRWLYQMDLAGLQDLKRNSPARYAEQHQGEPPHKVATDRLVKRFELNPRDIERLRKK
jgi:hypothetical protein